MPGCIAREADVTVKVTPCVRLNQEAAPGWIVPAPLVWAFLAFLPLA